MKHNSRREWLGKDGRWRVYVRAFLGREPSGKQIVRTKTCVSPLEGESKEAKDAARQAADKFLTDTRGEFRETGTVTEPSRETLAAYGREWLAGRRSEEGLKRRTWEGYSDIFRSLVEEPTDPNMPRIGRVQMRQLRPEHVKELYNYLRNTPNEQGRKNWGRAKALHALLGQVFRYAYNNDAITINLAEKLRGFAGRQPGRGRPECYSEEQLAAFLRAADRDPQRAFWYLFAFTGIRPGELLALTADDVDLEAGTVIVSKRLRQVPKRHRRTEAERWEIDEPKTENSVREVPLPEGLLSILRPVLWVHEQRARRRRKKGPWADLLFQTSTGQPLGWTNMRKSYARICRRAGLGTFVGEPVKKRKGQPGPPKQRPFKPLLKPYALRHTHATLLLEDGVPIEVVSEQLGHSKTSFTHDTYIGKGKRRRRLAAAAADRRLKRILNTGEDG